jgi:hypothetical protein
MGSTCHPLHPSLHSPSHLAAPSADALLQVRHHPCHGRRRGMARRDEEVSQRTQGRCGGHPVVAVRQGAAAQSLARRFGASDEQRNGCTRLWGSCSRDESAGDSPTATNRAGGRAWVGGELVARDLRFPAVWSTDSKEERWRVEPRKCGRSGRRWIWLAAARCQARLASFLARAPTSSQSSDPAAPACRHCSRSSSSSAAAPRSSDRGLARGGVGAAVARALLSSSRHLRVWMRLELGVGERGIWRADGGVVGGRGAQDECHGPVRGRGRDAAPGRRPAGRRVRGGRGGGAGADGGEKGHTVWWRTEKLCQAANKASTSEGSSRRALEEVVGPAGGRRRRSVW